MRRWLVALGGLIAAGAVAVALLASSSAATTSGQTVTWTGNGTDNGFCSDLNEGLSGIPPGEQGWLFILTSPATGPWTLTTSFSPAGGTSTSGTQMGNGSVHFVVLSPIGAKLPSASATNGTDKSVLTVSGCTVGTETTTTTKPVVTTTTKPTTTTTKPTTTTTAASTTTTKPSTTTSKPPTTPTSSPTTTTSPTGNLPPPPLKPQPITTTTLPNISSEQQQLQAGQPSGVTNGNG